ncbi:MAG: hypothetical protein ACI837_001089 [Crocinitomicaceae bacterium]|jgi:hypothetical protein
MKYLIFFVFVNLIALGSFAESKGPQMAEWWIESNAADSTVPTGKAGITLNVPYINVQAHPAILYGYNGTSFSGTLDENNQVRFELPPGKYTFQFYPQNGSEYYEIQTDSIEVTQNFMLTLRLNFRSNAPRNNLVKKPVIYLYPKKKTDVTVQLIPKGKLTFTYPNYQDGWKFSAEPNGDLSIGENTYNYLFWEAAQTNLEQYIDPTKGAIIQGSEITSFLEKQLRSFGFNGKERADFITFWAPQIVNQGEIFIHFKVNEECKIFADLEITPAPDKINRFYMLWGKAPTDFQRNNLKPQNLPSMKRQGFTVLEWGGAEVNISAETATLHY